MVVDIWFNPFLAWIFGLPYSAYILRLFNFANFTNLESLAKFIQLKFEPLCCGGICEINSLLFAKI